MKQTGEWVNSRTIYTQDIDYVTARGVILAFVRPEDGKWAVFNMADIKLRHTPRDITYSTLDEAKAVAEAIVAMT